MTARVPLALAEKVDDLALRLDRSRGWILTEALSMWVAQQEQRLQWTLDALADVDAGRIVDHKDVRAWVDGLDAHVPARVRPR